MLPCLKITLRSQLFTINFSLFTRRSASKSGSLAHSTTKGPSQQLVRIFVKAVLPLQASYTRRIRPPFPASARGVTDGLTCDDETKDGCARDRHQRVTTRGQHPFVSVGLSGPYPSPRPEFHLSPEGERWQTARLHNGVIYDWLSGHVPHSRPTPHRPP